jgi:hypothetical protein
VCGNQLGDVGSVAGRVGPEPGVGDDGPGAVQPCPVGEPPDRGADGSCQALGCRCLRLSAGGWWQNVSRASYADLQMYGGPLAGTPKAALGR